MADEVTYSRIVQILDNTAYIEALKREEQEQRILNALRDLGGKEAVTAYRKTEAAAKKAASGPSALTVAMQENAKGTSATAAAVQQLGFQFNDLFTQISSGTSVTQAFMQQGGQILQLGSALPAALTAIGGKFLALAPAIAATGAILSPFILLWKDYTDAKEAALEADERWLKVNKAGQSVIDESAAAVRALTLELAPMTAQQRELEDINNKWADSTKRETAALDEQIRIVEAQIGMNSELVAINRERKIAGEDELEIIRKTSPEYAAQTQLLARLKGRKEQVTAAGREGFEAERRLAQARRESEEQDRALEQAEKDLEERRKKAKEEQDKRAREELAALEARRAAVEAEADSRARALQTVEDALRDLSRVAEGEAKTDEERIARAAQAARERAIATATEAREVAITASQRLRVEEELQSALAQIKLEELEDYKEIERKKTDATEKEAEERRKIIKDTATDAVGELLGGLDELTSQIASNQADTISGLQEAIENAEEKGQTARAAALKRNLEEEQRAAMKVFELQRALKLANAGMAYGEALMTAAALPPPADVIKGVAATAALGLSIATINSEQPPTFTDTPPGGFRPSAMGRTATFAEDDTVVAARSGSTLIAKSIEAAMSRMMPTSAPARRRPSAARDMATRNPARLLTQDVDLVARARLSRPR